MQDRLGGGAALPAPEAARTWQAQAVGEHERSLPDGHADLRAGIAARVYALTGRRIAPEDVHVGAEKHPAIQGVDDVPAPRRARRRDLVVVRP